MQKKSFSALAALRTPLGELTTLPRIQIPNRTVRGHPLLVSSVSISAHIRNEVVIGPRENGLPTPLWLSTGLPACVDCMETLTAAWVIDRQVIDPIFTRIVVCLIMLPMLILTYGAIITVTLC